jgi:hypothetical protein
MFEVEDLDRTLGQGKEECSADWNWQLTFSLHAGN